MRYIKTSTDFMPPSLKENELLDAVYQSLREVHQASFMPIKREIVSMVLSATAEELHAIAKDLCIPVYCDTWGTQYLQRQILFCIGEGAIRGAPTLDTIMQSKAGIMALMRSLGYHPLRVLEFDQSSPDWEGLPDELTTYCAQEFRGRVNGFFIVIEDDIPDTEYQFLLDKLRSFFPMQRLIDILSTDWFGGSVEATERLDRLGTQELDPTGDYFMGWTQYSKTFNVSDGATYSDYISQFADFISNSISGNGYWSAELMESDYDYRVKIGELPIYMNYIYNSGWNIGFLVMFIAPYAVDADDPDWRRVCARHSMVGLHNFFDYEAPNIGLLQVYAVPRAQYYMLPSSITTLGELASFLESIDAYSVGAVIPNGGDDYCLPAIQRDASRDTLDTSRSMILCRRGERYVKLVADVSSECIIFRLLTLTGTGTATYAIYCGNRQQYWSPESEEIAILFPTRDPSGSTPSWVKATGCFHGDKHTPRVDAGFMTPYTQAVATYFDQDLYEGGIATFTNSELEYTTGRRRLRVFFATDDFAIFMRTRATLIEPSQRSIPVSPVYVQIMPTISQMATWTDDYGESIASEKLRESIVTLNTSCICLSAIKPPLSLDVLSIQDQELGEPNPEYGEASHFKCIGGGLIIGC